MLLIKKQLLVIAELFYDHIKQALCGQESSLKLLPSFIGRVSGMKPDFYAALDFGGTNVRAFIIRIDNNGQCSIEKEKVAAICQSGEYDFKQSTVTGEELFDWLAILLKQVCGVEATYALGHTFSFPCRQESINQAFLIRWTKEFQTAGVVDQEVQGLLQQALWRAHMAIRPVAILNDTTATLLSQQASLPETDIASICGTGHNTCYLEPCSPQTGKAMILNLESGGFDCPFSSEYDNFLDARSEQPGKQRLEKMVSGKYIGELVRVLAQNEYRRNLSPNWLRDYTQPYSLSTAAVAKYLQYNDVLTEISQHVIMRSAQIVAATHCGIIMHLDPDLDREHVIAIDGSLYGHIPVYGQKIENTLELLLGRKHDKIHIVYAKDASGIGAAVAASYAEHSVII